MAKCQKRQMNREMTITQMMGDVITNFNKHHSKQQYFPTVFSHTNNSIFQNMLFQKMKFFFHYFF